MRHFKIVFMVICAFTVGFNISNAFIKPADPLEILQKADEARGNLEGVNWEVSVVSSEKKRVNKLLYDVKARGFDSLALVQLRLVRRQMLD